MKVVDDRIPKPPCPECGREMQRFGWSQWYCNFCAQFYKEDKPASGLIDRPK